MSTEVAALEAVAEATRPEQPQVMAPEPDWVDLPIGLPTLSGVVTQAQVRELNGFDEEAIARSKSNGQAILTILERATVRVGDEKATPELLREMYLADRVAILVGISRCTWGANVVTTIRCPHCEEVSEIDYDLDDLEITTADPADARFEVQLKKGTAKAHWPKGDVHEAIINMKEDTTAQFRTTLINKCVDEINEVPIFGDAARRLSVGDRSTLVSAINDVYMGPRLDQTSVPCPSCGKEVSPALSLAELFPI